MRDAVVAAFRDHFGGSPALIVRSPGRVNLIGDHTDYNDGFVLPMAIEHATWIAARPRPDRAVHLESVELGSGAIHIDNPVKQGTWVDYVTGTIWALDLSLPHGFDAAIGTSVPVGAGLSSSAALEVGVARLVHALAGESWDPVAAARAGQRAENDFVGMPCGIMDQLIVAGGVAGSALLIDCRTLATTAVPIPDDVGVVVLDTGTRRELVDSEYELRRAACERVAAALGIPALRDATIADLDRVDLDPTDRRRAHHVITENERTVLAADAFAAGDKDLAGRLMMESHRSLRDDYETSGPALDTMVDIALQVSGCLGARVTGAGFAGCAVALVDGGAVDPFFREVSDAYRTATGIEPQLYPTHGAAGADVE